MFRRIFLLRDNWTLLSSFYPHFSPTEKVLFFFIRPRFRPTVQRQTRSIGVEIVLTKLLLLRVHVKVRTVRRSEFKDIIQGVPRREDARVSDFASELLIGV